MTTPPETPENYDACICSSCPSYPGDDKVLYCGRGKSDKKINPEGCICPQGCPIFSQYKLNSMYYCMGGKAK
ncbi:hypothetical protein CUJ83_10775 [Methanocella sp. CWC-04]|uniref:DUF2769 domain-containing protein n=1 Tax=Methanooceanicella nereidis TaxID=2052831 RepID=A0AAP2W6N6_9EURY|nr:DUF2769 domain-containing protein [Methanocella sp. CWC-04]MCD1295482.1 hypothetical protein [Methanocella sp. CWC-04]